MSRLGWLDTIADWLFDSGGRSFRFIVRVADPPWRTAKDVLGKRMPGPWSAVPWSISVLYAVAVAAPFAAAWIIRERFDVRFVAVAFVVVLFWVFVVAALKGEESSDPGRRGIGLALATGALLVAFALLPRIESLLEALFLAGEDSFGMSQGVFESEGLTGGRNAAAEAVRVWQDFSATASDKTPGPIIALWWLLIDSAILVPAYGLLLLKWVLDRRGPLGSRLARGETAAVALWLRRLTVVVVAVDLIENTLAAAVITGAGTLDGLLGPSAWLLSWFASLKWLVAILIAVPALLLYLPKRRELRSDRPLGHGLVMARFQVLALLTLLIFGVFFADQLEDVVVDASVVRLGTVAVAAGGLGLLLSATSRGLIEADRFRTDAAISEAVQRRLQFGLSVGFVAMLAWTQLHRDSAPAGIAVGLGLIVVVWLLSWRIGKSAGRRAAVLRLVPSDRPATPSLRVPGLIAGTPLLLLGYWLVQATAKLALYEDIGWELFSKVAVGAVMVVAACLIILWQWEGARRRWGPLIQVDLGNNRRVLGHHNWYWMADHDPPPAAIRAYRQFYWWNSRQDATIVWAVRGYIVAAGLCIYVSLDVVARAPYVGALLILYASLAVLSGLGSSLVLVADWVSDRLSPAGENLPPELFRVAGLNRIPVLSLLVVWLVVNQLLLGSGDHFDVRTAPSGTDSVTARNGIPLDGAFAAWADRTVSTDCRSAPKDGDSTALLAVPIVVVSSEGGGIRAAYWMASVLDGVFSDERVAVMSDPCEHDRPAWDHVFAASGISGGSVGIAAYLQEQASGSVASEGWEKLRLAGEREFLSAPLSWLLVPELVGWHYLRIPMPTRVEFHEQALEQAWGFDSRTELPEGLQRLYRDSGTGVIGPAVIFNAATVANGCVLNVGPLGLSTGDPRSGCLDLRSGLRDLSGGIDATPLVCANQDLSIFTASMVSARFPVISPSARFHCAEGPDVSAIDGGGVDASGALTPLLLWPDLLDVISTWNAAHDGACLVPIHIHVDNGGERLAQSVDSFDGGQVAAFRTAQSEGSSSRNDRARLALADTFDAPYSFVRNGTTYTAMAGDNGRTLQSYYRVFPPAQPAARAPLGWFLSGVATELMDDQLEEIENELMEVRKAVAGPLTCVPTP